MFEEFEKGSHTKEQKRFGASLAASALICSVSFGGLVAASAAARSVVQEEDLLQVEFALPEEAPPPPPPAPAELAPRPKPKPSTDVLAPPDEIPDERPEESDGPLAEAPVVQEAPVAAPEPPPAPAVVEAPPPPPRPKAPSGPVQLPEQATPPVAMAGNTPPEYPEEARKTGVQAVVIAKITIREDGTVSNVDILRGPDIFHAPVKAALMTWRYEPARLPDGTAISVFRIVQLPFKLENM